VSLGFCSLAVRRARGKGKRVASGSIAFLALTNRAPPAKILQYLECSSRSTH
jgi:hypothetical protein